jgi:hypothetical protein
MGIDLKRNKYKKKNKQTQKVKLDTLKLFYSLLFKFVKFVTGSYLHIK